MSLTAELRVMGAGDVVDGGGAARYLTCKLVAKLEVSAGSDRMDTSLMEDAADRRADKS